MNSSYNAYALQSTDEEVGRLIAHAKRAHHGTDDALYAEILDNLVRVSWNLDREDVLSAAEDMVDVATKIRDRADADLMEWQRSRI